MLLILYIVQAICNQTLSPGTPTQLETNMTRVLFLFKIYISYSNIFFLCLNKLFQNYFLNFIYRTSHPVKHCRPGP